jgi:hypothetical protein
MIHDLFVGTRHGASVQGRNLHILFMDFISFMGQGRDLHILFMGQGRIGKGKI